MKLAYMGHEYHRNSICGNREYFRCARYKANDCRARLTRDGDSIIVHGNHVCEIQAQISGIASSSKALEIVKDMASQTGYGAAQIYQHVIEQVADGAINAAIEIPTRRMIAKTVREIRGISDDNSIPFNQPPYSLTQFEGRPFMRRNWEGDIDGDYHKVIIWASNETLSVLRTECQVFIDGTFRIVPAGFKQCVIVMGYDSSINEFVPCVWSLLSGKSEYLYCVLLHEIIVLLQYKWRPKACVVDFEKALVNAAIYEFGRERVKGCYFHFKQALFRKIKKLEIPDLEAKRCSSELELLTIVSHEDITIAIQYIKSIVQCTGRKWQTFWEYFSNTWLVRYPPSMWNLSEVRRDDISARTNNALERYNRKLNEKFPNPHPNLIAFIKVLQSEESYYTKLARNIRQGSIKMNYEFREFNKKEIPREFVLYRCNPSS